MPPKKYGLTTPRQQPASTVQEERDEGELRVVGGATPAPTETQMVVEEVSGSVSPDAFGFGGETGMEADGAHAEVSAEGTESAEEYAEATAEQLAAAPPVDESALSDLRNIEGFEELAGEEAAEAAARPGLLPEAGTAIEGRQEFFPIVGAIASAVLPTLISKIGPKIAKGVALAWIIR